MCLFVVNYLILYNITNVSYKECTLQYKTCFKINLISVEFEKLCLRNMFSNLNVFRSIGAFNFINNLILGFFQYNFQHLLQMRLTNQYFSTCGL